MYIEKNHNAQTLNIWVDKDHYLNYKDTAEYKSAVAESKAAGYQICVFVGGDLPIIPVIEDVVTSNTIWS